MFWVLARSALNVGGAKQEDELASSILNPDMIGLEI